MEAVWRIRSLQGFCKVSSTLFLNILSRWRWRDQTMTIMTMDNGVKQNLYFSQMIDYAGVFATLCSLWHIFGFLDLILWDFTDNTLWILHMVKPKIWKKSRLVFCVHYLLWQWIWSTLHISDILLHTCAKENWKYVKLQKSFSYIQVKVKSIQIGIWNMDEEKLKELEVMHDIWYIMYNIQYIRYNI